MNWDWQVSKTIKPFIWRRERREWELGMTGNVNGVSFWGDDIFLKLECDDGRRTLDILKQPSRML